MRALVPGPLRRGVGVRDGIVVEHLRPRLFGNMLGVEGDIAKTTVAASHRPFFVHSMLLGKPQASLSALVFGWIGFRCGSFPCSGFAVGEGGGLRVSSRIADSKNSSRVGMAQGAHSLMQVVIRGKWSAGRA